MYFTKKKAAILYYYYFSKYCTCFNIMPRQSRHFIRHIDETAKEVSLKVSALSVYSCHTTMCVYAVLTTRQGFTLSQWLSVANLFVVIPS